MKTQIPDSGENVGSSSFEQEADLGLSAILGSDRGPRQFFEEIALACPFFICVLKIWASIAVSFCTVAARRPSDHCELF